MSSLRNACLPLHPRAAPSGGWEGWSAWTSCSSARACGPGVETRLRFCSSTSDPGALCRGPRVASRPCSGPPCSSSTSSPSPTAPPAPVRPPQEPGAAPCSCGCTFLVGGGRRGRRVQVVSGRCARLPVHWTLRAPRGLALAANLTAAAFSCPALRLNLRDGTRPTDKLLLQAFPTSQAAPTSFRSSGREVQVELASDLPSTDLSACWVEFTLMAHAVPPATATPPSLLPAPLHHFLKVSTPILLLVALVVVIVICTVVMVADFHIKKAKYRKWKALPPSGLTTPIKGCLTFSRERQLFASLSTISDYVPLVASEPARAVAATRSLPASPAPRRRRRLLRRSETLGSRPARRRAVRRTLSLSRTHLPHYTSVDAVDGGEVRLRGRRGRREGRRVIRESGTCSQGARYSSVASSEEGMRRSEERMRRSGDRVRRSEEIVRGSEDRMRGSEERMRGSEDRMRGTSSVGEFSTHSGEME